MLVSQIKFSSDLWFGMSNLTVQLLAESNALMSGVWTLACEASCRLHQQWLRRWICCRFSGCRQRMWNWYWFESFDGFIRYLSLRLIALLRLVCRLHRLSKHNRLRCFEPILFPSWRFNLNLIFQSVYNGLDLRFKFSWSDSHRRCIIVNTKWLLISCICGIDGAFPLD